MSPRVASLLLAVLLPLAACAPAEESPGGQSEATDEPTPEPDSASQVPEEPKAGTYVYDLVGVGTTEARVPRGSQLTEALSVSGNIYTVEVTNNQNANAQRTRFRWDEDRVLQLSIDRVIGGRRTSCTYDPPLELMRFPLRQEEYREQKATGCDETTQISVAGRQEIDDATGKTWATWILEVQSASGGRTDQSTRWFSPELGREIRIDTVTDTSSGQDETSQLLRSYPSG